MNFSEYTINLLGLENLASLSTLERTCFSSYWTEKQYSLILLPQSLPLDLINVRKNLPGVLVFGIFIRKHLVGYISLRVLSAVAEVEIYNVAVQENLRGKGIASYLFDSVLNILTLCELEIIHLEVRENNISALALYKKFGFVKRGIRKKYYPDGENALIMTYDLTVHK